jgi:putative peptide zinc metalloprotease protein
VALVLPVCGLGAVVAGGSAGMPLTGSERTLLLLLAAVVAGGAVAVPRLRAPAIAAATAVALAAAPWNGAAVALPAAVVAGALAAALLRTEGAPGEAPLRPWLKGAVASGAVLLTLAGALFLPLRAPELPHAALAGWLTGPGVPAGRVAVPAGLWGDLVRDGVPADRLVRNGGPGDGAELLVAPGRPASGAAVAVFGSGSTALVVEPVPPGDADLRVAVAEERAAAAEQREAAAEQADAAAGSAERQDVGSLIAGSPRLSAPAEVRAVLRDGRVDRRVLVVLRELVGQHRVTISDLPPAPGGDPALALRHRVVVTGFDGRAVPADPHAAALLTDRLRAWQPPLAPVDVSSGPAGITIGWTPSPASGPEQ